MAAGFWQEIMAITSAKTAQPVGFMGVRFGKSTAFCQAPNRGAPARLFFRAPCRD
jgi:hypothetical protein